MGAHIEGADYANVRVNDQTALRRCERQADTSRTDPTLCRFSKALHQAQREIEPFAQTERSHQPRRGKVTSLTQSLPQMAAHTANNLPRSA